MRDHFGTEEERDRARTDPRRVSAQDGDERDDLIDTDDPEQRRTQALLTLKDKVRYYKIDKGRTADTFVDIFGEELTVADPELIERYITLIVQLGGLPEIDPGSTEQHPAVVKLMAVRDAKADVQEQMAADRDGIADQAAIDRDNVEHR